jgi:hypothetical protein
LQETAMPRKDRRKKNDDLVVGFGWYDRAQWQRLTEVVPDRSELDSTFEQWETSATETFEGLRRNGVKVKRIDVDVEAMLAWCAERSLPLTSEARAEYITYETKRRDQQSKA